MITIILCLIFGFLSACILFELSHWKIFARYYGNRSNEKTTLFVSWLISLGALIWWLL